MPALATVRPQPGGPPAPEGESRAPEPRADADPAEVISVLVKQLVRTTATHYELTQHNPPLTFRIAKAEVAEIHRIIPLAELLS